uniref:ATP synthase complex subunit 8 n=1 Tax=Trogoderma variabile TaxID=888089 RepID=A0A6B9MKN8_9COLE
MPQMAPMNWLSLFIVFSITLMIMNSMNFFSNLNTPKSTLIKKINIKTNWKW